MKRILPFAFFFLATQLVVSLQSFAQCTGANMYNPIVVGTIGAGTNYSNTQYNGNSCFGNDYGQPSYDIYYQFTITSSLQVNISLCGSGFDTYVWLLDGNGNQIAYNDDYGPLCSTNESSISQTLGAGTYYVVSEGYSSNVGNIVTQISIPGSAGGSGGTSVGWAANGSDIYNTNTGNVGIGTSTPRGALDVKKDADVYLLNSTNGGSTSSNFLSGHVYFAPYSTSDVVYLQARRQNELGSTVLRFRTTNNGQLVDAMNIGSAGNIGIGTNTPDQRLTIKGGGIGFDGNSADKKLYSPVDGTLEWMTNDGASEHALAVSHQGTKRVYLNTNGNSYFTGGNMGIGTMSPEVKLHVNGESRYNGPGWFSRSSNGNDAVALSLGQNLNTDVPVFQISTSDNGGTNYSKWVSSRWGHVLNFQRNSSAGIKNMVELGGYEGGGHYLSVFSNDGSTQKISLSADGVSYVQGSLAIGSTSTQGYKLSVNGDAIFTKIKVKSYSTWPDYVFAPAYRLPSLAQVEAFIHQYNHLPEVPSAKEVEEKGLDVGDNQAVLLKKIEELTLYIIDQNKKIEQLEKEVQSIKAARTN